MRNDALPVARRGPAPTLRYPAVLEAPKVRRAFPLWRVTGLSQNTPKCRWQLVPVSGPAPNARLGHIAIFDPVGRALVIEGGEYQGSSFRDVQVLKGVFRR